MGKKVVLKKKTIKSKILVKPHAKAVSVLNSVFGENIAYRMADSLDVTQNAVATGITAFDYGLLGIGGLPRGHFVELSGPEKAGKTTLVLHMIAAAQRSGLVPLVVDAKNAVSTDVARAQRIGVDPDSVVIAGIDSSESALLGMRESLRLLRKDGIGLAFFWDDMGLTPSIYEINPKKDKKTGVDIVRPGAKAAAIWRFCRTMAGECYRSGAVMVVVNQLTAVINSGWSPPGAPTETTSGGKGLKYTARIRIDIRGGKRIKIGDTKIGQVVHVRTSANTFFPPERKVLLHLHYRNGYSSKLSSVLNAEATGIVSKKRGLYTLKGTEDVWPVDALPEDIMHAMESRLWPWINSDYDFVDGSNDVLPDSDSGDFMSDDEVADDKLANAFA